MEQLVHRIKVKQKMIGVKLLVTMLVLGILAEKGSGLDCYKCKGKGCGDPFSSDDKEKETCGASTPPASRPTNAPTVATSTTPTTTTAPTTTTTAAIPTIPIFPTAPTVPVVPTIPEFPTPTTAPTTVPIPESPPTPITVPTTVPIPTIPESPPTPITVPTTVPIPTIPEFPTPTTVPTSVPIPTIPEFPTPTTAPTTVPIPESPPTPITVPTTVQIPTIGTFPTADSETVRKEDTETTNDKYPAVHLLPRRSRQPNRDENYVCVKYTEKDGDDDVIVRGCASTSQNDDVCQGKTNCNTCADDLCNASNKMTASIFIIASTTLIVLASQL